MITMDVLHISVTYKKRREGNKSLATFGGIFNIPYLHLPLYSANLVVPAAVRHSADKLEDDHFLCTAVYVSQPQEAHTHF